MKQAFILLFILSSFVFSQEALSGSSKFYTVPDTVFINSDVIDIIEHNNGVWLIHNRGLNFTFDNGYIWLHCDTGQGLVSQLLSSIYPQGTRLWIASNHDTLVEENTLLASDGLSSSDDNGENWHQVNFGPEGLDIPKVWGLGCTIYDITGDIDIVRNLNWLFIGAYYGGFLGSQDGGNNWRRLYASADDSIQYNTEEIPSLRNLYFACVADTSHGDSLFVWTGTASGIFQYCFAWPKDTLINPDTLKADTVINYTYSNTMRPLYDTIIDTTIIDTNNIIYDTTFILLDVDTGLTGDFIQAMGVQYRPGKTARIWTSGNRVSSGFPGISAGEYIPVIDEFGDTTGFQIQWQVKYRDYFAWNYAFHGDTVLAASDIGLLMYIEDLGPSWDTVALGEYPKSESPRVYSVEVTGDFIWVGTENCTYRLNIDNFSEQTVFCGSCCEGHTGNTDCSPDENPDISDITVVIDYLYINHRPLCCPEETDCDGSGGYPDSDPDISDILAIIDYLYLDHTPLAPCHTFLTPASRRILPQRFQIRK